MTSVVLCPIVIHHTCMLLNATHCTTYYGKRYTLHTLNYLVLESLQVSIYNEVDASVAVKEMYMYYTVLIL